VDDANDASLPNKTNNNNNNNNNNNKDDVQQPPAGAIDQQSTISLKESSSSEPQNADAGIGEATTTKKKKENSSASPVDRNNNNKKKKKSPSAGSNSNKSVDDDDDDRSNEEQTPSSSPTKKQSTRTKKRNTSSSKKKKTDKNREQKDDTTTPGAGTSSVSSKNKRQKSTPSGQQKSLQRQQQPAPTLDNNNNSDGDDDDDIIPTKPPPTMDVAVHRVRHLSYVPKPILCLATTPFHKHACDYTAVSRDNGSVELKCADQKWRTVANVAGLRTRPVDAMAWLCCSGEEEGEKSEQGNRDGGGVSFSSSFHQSSSRIHARRTLIGASRDGTIFVVDFQSGRHVAVTGSGGGGVFSLVSLCGQNAAGCSSGCSRMVAAGCEDGSVRIYQLHNNNDDENQKKLNLVSTIPCAGSAILSLAWLRHAEDLHGRGIRGTVLYAGVADGTIRRFDCKSALATAIARGTSAHAISTGTSLIDEGRASDTAASWKSTLRMTVESLGRATPTRVWALEALSDGTVVSGDSLGHVQLWDGAIGTLLQSFDQNDSKADVLALAISGSECRVYASGVDSRVVCIERPEATPDNKDLPMDGRRWVMTHAQRPHTHDVKALTVCRLQDTSGTIKPRDKPTEILCSGGVDTKLCTYLMKDFRKIRPKNWYPWPCQSPICVAKEARVLTMTREDRVDIYRLASANSQDSYPILVPEEDTLIGTIEVEGARNLVCSALSTDGKYLAISGLSTLMVFRVDYEEGQAVPTRLSVPSEVQGTCTALRFASDKRLACSVAEGIQIFRMTDETHDEESGVSLDHRFESRRDALGLSCVYDLQVSSDGQWLAAVRNGLGGGAIQVYSIADGNYRHIWSLPPLGAPCSAVGFVGGDKVQLAVTCTNFAFYVFDLERRRLCPWSEKNGFPVSLPSELKHRSDYPVRIACDPASPNRFLMVRILLLSATSQDRYYGAPFVFLGCWIVTLARRNIRLISPVSVIFACTGGIVKGNNVH
jgi:U3 small nucleolar RNA-associated protein 4